MLKSVKRLMRPKTEKVAEAIEEDVMNAMLAYGRAQLPAKQMPVFVASLNLSMAEGGMNLAEALNRALEAAKETKDDQ